jgi:hypothetical protein
MAMSKGIRSIGSRIVETRIVDIVGRCEVATSHSIVFGWISDNGYVDVVIFRRKGVPRYVLVFQDQQ